VKRRIEDEGGRSATPSAEVLLEESTATYYLQFSASSVYPGGNYFKGSSTEPKDVRFQIWGAPTP
jgi:hypothetical protein